MKHYSTPQAAERIGVSLITLYRWLRDGLIQPKGIPMRRGVIWTWTEADIAKGRKVKAEQKPGPKPGPKRGAK